MADNGTPLPAGVDSFAEFVTAWNTQQGRPTPELHRRMAEWLYAAWQTGDRRLLLLVFRGAGKSTLVALFCAWLLYRKPDLRILVLAADHGLACKMTRNVRRIVEVHQLTGHLVPSPLEEWASDRFTVSRDQVHRDPSLLARGIDANITGCRADLIVCDDVEVPRTCGTAGKRETLREHLREAGFVLVPGGMQLVVGTPHSYHSIYAAEPRADIGEERPFLDGYRRLVIPIVDAAGQPAWPERFDAAEIESNRRHYGPAKFRSQMLLEPTDVREIRLDPERLVRYEGELELMAAGSFAQLRIAGRRMVSAACCWDPALGRPDAGDASVIAAVFQDEGGEYWLHAIRYMTAETPHPQGLDEATQLCRQVRDFVVANELPSVIVESNGLGGFLPGLLRSELARAGVAAAVLAQAASRRKEARILDALDPLLAARRLHVHASVWETPFIREMREWLPDGRSRDDGLDAVSGCLLAQPARLTGRLGSGRRAAWRPGQSHAADASFEV
ncbi:MAG: phage terminase large subunit [Geminicoccaceae bacterium]